MAHRKVMEQVVTARLGSCCRHFLLRENPLQALDGQLTHILDGVIASHDDVHTCQTTHWPNIDYVFFRLRISKPRRHQVFYTVYGGRSHGRFLVGFRYAQVESGETFIHT